MSYPSRRRRLIATTTNTKRGGFDHSSFHHSVVVRRRPSSVSVARVNRIKSNLSDRITHLGTKLDNSMIGYLASHDSSIWVRVKKPKAAVTFSCRVVHSFIHNPSRRRRRAIVRDDEGSFGGVRLIVSWGGSVDGGTDVLLLFCVCV
jgi:hypothetical protein